MIVTIFNSMTILCALFCIWLLSRDMKDVEDKVDSHWKATQNECSMIWEKIDEGSEQDGDC